MAAFEGCALSRTATNTVFADGVAGRPSDDHRRGARCRRGPDRPALRRPQRPACWTACSPPSAIDRERNAYITNVLFWRPPGNRKPTDDETEACLPFVWRHIALGRPRVVMLCGSTATSALLGGRTGITRLRGRWFALEVPGLDRPVPAMPTYHPSYLLRQPARKGEAWHDLLAVQSKLESSE